MMYDSYKFFQMSVKSNKVHLALLPIDSIKKYTHGHKGQVRGVLKRPVYVDYKNVISK